MRTLVTAVGMASFFLGQIAFAGCDGNLNYYTVDRLKDKAQAVGQALDKSAFRSPQWEQLNDMMHSLTSCIHEKESEQRALSQAISK